MSSRPYWLQLLDFLNTWASAYEVAPGRIEVALDKPGGQRKVVTIVMTPTEWEDMAGVLWGDVDLALQEVRRVLLRVGHEKWLVYDQYELVPADDPDGADRR